MKKVDLAIVGAGIVGLAHAVHAARAGMSVAVFEREPEARGASVQNFGMLALIAQAAGKQLDDARRALAWWRDVSAKAGIKMTPSGCLLLAREPEEMQVLEEFAASASGHSVQRLTPEELTGYAPGLRTEQLLGGVWSADAWKVDQRQAMGRIAAWLRRAHGVSIYYDAIVTEIDPPKINTSAGPFQAEHTLLCTGDEFDALFPEIFKETGITRCRLQMMRTTPQREDWKLTPFVLGGLSLARYASFADCSSLPDLVALQARKKTAYVTHGIHVIAAQETDGSVTIGDSHAYGEHANGERSEIIDRLILDDLDGMISLPDPRIAERWFGHYAHLPGTDMLKVSPVEGATAITMTNGQGMTHGFAIAADMISDLTD